MDRWSGHWIVLVIFAVLALAIFIDSTTDQEDEDDDG